MVTLSTLSAAPRPLHNPGIEYKLYYYSDSEALVATPSWNEMHGYNSKLPSVLQVRVDAGTGRAVQLQVHSAVIHSSKDCGTLWENKIRVMKGCCC